MSQVGVGRAEGQGHSICEHIRGSEMKGDAVINDIRTIGVNGTVLNKRGHVLAPQRPALVLQIPFCFFRSDASLLGSVDSS